ncbi:MAG: hypothetical protein JOZ43_06590 [Acidobacteriales bacterium]|nr:hypothetical protein [Terriglobales bacterium]
MPAESGLQHLIDLDRIDREITRLDGEIAALPKRIAEIEKQHAAAKAKLDVSHARVKTIETERRRHESDIKDTHEKIAKLRSQSSSVKTNEQYKALLHEIAFAEQEISTLETKILEGMEAADALAPQIKLAETEYAAEAKRIDEEKRHAASLTESDKRELAKYQGQRTELRQAVLADVTDGDRWLAHYDRVAKGRGYAVALAKDARCMACHVAIRPQTWNQILKGADIIACDSCSRILWTKDEVPRQEDSLKKQAQPAEA